MTASLAGVRIVIVNNFPGPGLGGGEVLMLALVRGLLLAGAEIHAVVVPESGFGARVTAAGGTVSEVPMSAANAKAAVRTVAEQIARDNPVVVMGTGYWTNLMVRQASRNTNARVINFVGVTPGASIADGGSRLNLAARRVVDRATASRVDAYVAVAQTVASALISDGARPESVHVIPNSVDIEALGALAREPVPVVPPGRPLVVCAGRLETVKGVEYLVRAAAHLPDVTVAIAGTGPLEGRLREIAVALGVTERVAFLGRIPQVAPLIAAADVVVLPSLSEGLPTVALEAMALARPVVATRVGGTPEAVEDEVTGLLVDPCDATGLAGALRRLTADPTLARALGEAGARRVQKCFTAQRMVDAYTELIADLVAAPPR